MQWLKCRIRGKVTVYLGLGHSHSAVVCFFLSIVTYVNALGNKLEVGNGFHIQYTLEPLAVCTALRRTVWVQHLSVIKACTAMSRMIRACNYNTASQCLRRKSRRSMFCITHLHSGAMSSSLSAEMRCYFSYGFISSLRYISILFSFCLDILGFESQLYHVSKKLHHFVLQ